MPPSELSPALGYAGTVKPRNASPAEPEARGNFGRRAKDKGLPIGLQLMGKQFDEKTVLRVAGAYENVQNT